MDYTSDYWQNMYASQVASAQSAQLSSYGVTSATGDSTFDDMLTSLSGDGNGTQTAARDYVLGGLLDGSLKVTDSEALVSALLSTVNTEQSGMENSLSGTTSLSDSIMKALDGYSSGSAAKTTEELLLEQINETIKTLGEVGGEDEENAQDYYNAMAALAQVQKNLLLG